MSEHSGETERRGIFTVIASRLAQNRWLLCAASIAIFVAYLTRDNSVAVPMLAILAVGFVVAFVPEGPANSHRIDTSVVKGRTALDGLSAIDLATAVADPLIIIDSRASAIHSNEAAIATFGHIGQGISVQLKFRAPEMQDLIGQAIAGGNPPLVTEYIERFPIERAFRVTATPIGGDTNLFVLVFEDQSETRRIDRMRADFIANASHELRTPLASIAGFVETLRGPARNDPTARDSFLQIMHNQTSRMARLIDDLLSLSRLEMKPFLTPGEKVDVRQTVESVIDSLSPLARDTGVSVIREFMDEPAVVVGSRDELFQVFENLLENACKYGQSGGKVVVTIAKAGPPANAELTVTFRDFGPGIPEEHIPRITERFYRVDVETSRAQKGTGLGLSIVKHILTRHNARLSIRSDAGNGAAFTVHFPLR